MHVRQQIIDTLYIMPTIVLITGVILYPVVRGIILGFQNVYILFPQPVKFVGFENYLYIFHHPDVLEVFRNTLVWLVGTVIFIIPIGLGLALLLNCEFRGKTLARTAILLPWAIPLVVVASCWKLMYETEGGIINHLLRQAGIITEPIKWLSSTGMSLPSVTVANIWRFIPFITLVLLAGLQSVDAQLYDAAKVDGANRWQRFRFITLPQIRYMLMIALVLGTIWTVNTFDIIYAMTQGGPLISSEILATYIYRWAFMEYEFSRAAALSTLLFLFVFALALAYMSLIQARPWEEAE
jgi:multiple sugar transport system permease protein